VSGPVLGLVGTGRIGVMHAQNIAVLERVHLRVTDQDAGRAAMVARNVGAEHVPDVPALLRSGIDGLVVAAGTSAHPDLIRAGVDAGIPVFCEKPVALSVEESLPILQYVTERRGIVQMGHQRRFDAGYLEARRALVSGELGWPHSIRAVTCDVIPPSVEFLATSGGIFRDCSVHDFDVLRWLTGREVVEVYAKGSNRGDPAIGHVGDVDTGVALVTLDDGTLATVVASRYNGAGHDVRLEIQGSVDTLVVGLDTNSALRSAETDMVFTGTPHANFAERFHRAYREEIAAFLDLVEGHGSNPCTMADSVAAAVVADAAQQSLQTGAPVRL
jgi:myo-inositol 2-dehydrogenase/D-chiro-inositol 1-dehydrogenase